MLIKINLNNLRHATILWPFYNITLTPSFVMTSIILTTSMIASVMLIAPFASGNFGGIMQQSLADPLAGPCQDGATINPTTFKCDTPVSDPICPDLYTYVKSGDECRTRSEGLPTPVPATCPEGATLNTASDKCVTSSDPIGKIPLCHIAKDKLVDIEVSVNALPAHLAHGDTLGPCERS